MRRWRRLLGAAAPLLVAGPLLLGADPAAGRTAESVPSAAVSGPVDLASVVDVEGFEARAAAWTAANADHRLAALDHAEELAAQTKAAQEAAEAEEARIAAEEAEQARIAAQEAEQARIAAQTTTTTTTTTTSAAPASDAADQGTDDQADEADDAAAQPEQGAVGGDNEAPVAGDPTADQWLALRVCEASNNYQAVSADGRYRGAYQFSVPTWDWLAALRYPELVGVDPASASPADQDRMALALYEEHGASPWPICGSVLL